MPFGQEAAVGWSIARIGFGRATGCHHLIRHFHLEQGDCLVGPKQNFQAKVEIPTWMEAKGILTKQTTFLSGDGEGGLNFPNLMMNLIFIELFHFRFLKVERTSVQECIFKGLSRHFSFHWTHFSAI